MDFKDGPPRTIRRPLRYRIKRSDTDDSHYIEMPVRIYELESTKVWPLPWVWEIEAFYREIEPTPKEQPQAGQPVHSQYPSSS